MRYILVNGRNYHGEGECAFCKTALGQTYVRDTTTGIVYHSHFCLDTHIASSVLLIEGNDVQHIEIR